MDDVLGCDGGVGPGFTIDDLMRWQTEILQKRRARDVGWAGR
jgi:hypothetical protein